MLHVKNKLVDVLLWIIALAFFAPLLWMFLSAFKTPAEIIQIPPSWTFKPTLSGLTFMVHHGTFWLYVFNSLFITLVSVVIAVVVSYLAAYSFSRFPNKATDFLMFILLSVRMVPGAAVVVPLYLMYTALNWIDSYTGIIAFDIMFSIPFSVWILKGFLDSVSRRFDESAAFDGASKWRTMFQIILPQVVPGIIAALIFNMVFVWNEGLFNSTIGGSIVETMPVAIQGGIYTVKGIDWQYIASLSFVYVIPLLAVIYFFQKYLLVGMTFGTVRGEM